MEYLSELHLLRPLWLLGFVPALVLGLLLLLKERNSVNWRQVVAPQFLNYLLENDITVKTRWTLILLIASWMFACVCLAGPTWQKVPQPVQKDEAAVVIVWDLSPSMLAEDLKPNRLTRARHKLTDFLNARNEGFTALIAYAGEAHVVSPLTDDNDTIINLLPALNPAMMPLAGSNIEMGVEKALQLFADANISKGTILVATDEITSDAQETLKDLLGDTDFRLSIFGIGTGEGAPIPTGNGGFAKDQYGSIVIVKLSTIELRELANELNGYYVGIQTDDRDVEYLADAVAQPFTEEDQMRLMEQKYDTWLDMGQYAVLLLLPVALLAFRRGWILPVCLVVIAWPQESKAFEWRDLWVRKEQQAQQNFDVGNHQQAAEMFSSKAWKGAAQYRADDYNTAANSFESTLATSSDSTSQADAQYNYGNALAKAGKLQDAIAAYDSALKIDPQLQDAEFNRQLVQSLLDQQKESEDGENSGEQGQNQEQNSEDSQQNSDDQSQQEQQSQESQAQSDSESSDNNNEQQAQEEGEQDQQSESEQSQNQQAQNEQKDNSEQQNSTNDNSEENGESSDEQQKMAQQQELNESEQTEAHEPMTAEQLSQLDSGLTEEQQQAMEQWLRQVPDDPSGLLRRKFNHQHQMLRRRYQNGEWQPPTNGATQRW